MQNLLYIDKPQRLLKKHRLIEKLQVFNQIIENDILRNDKNFMQYVPKIITFVTPENIDIIDELLKDIKKNHYKLSASLIEL